MLDVQEEPWGPGEVGSQGKSSVSLAGHTGQFWKQREGWLFNISSPDFSLPEKEGHFLE